MNARRFFHTPRWKKTALGSDIALAAAAPLADLQGQRPILLMGGVHGDEPEGVALAEATLRWLEEATAAGEKLAPWVLVPCLNVDGYRANQRVNGRGVDLNRNYPSRDWSPTADKPRYHPGPAPGSEPEIQGVVELLQGLKPRLVIHCHSWEPCIVATGAPAWPDAKRLAAASGYEVREEIGYPTPGSLSRYGWHDHGLPVICIEEREKLEDLNSVWPHFADGIKQIFRDLSMRS